MDLVRIEARQLIFDHLAQGARPNPAGTTGLKRRPLAAAILGAPA
jgi:hypothetical protein